MSKTTQRNGKPNYIVAVTIQADVKPSWRLKRQWERLDEYAQKEFHKPYDALSDKDKSTLHYNINIGKYKKEEDASKSS